MIYKHTIEGDTAFLKNNFEMLKEELMLVCLQELDQREIQESQAGILVKQSIDFFNAYISLNSHIALSSVDEAKALLEIIKKIYSKWSTYILNMFFDA
mmetsp:Transcript_5486/g.5017  ORF Transcript_5486/g.5017 Transcript_5486/m.5017 type:complete len:98 (-) Transcript_5486:63-356(-)|eukprot:CAMPEP_0170553592 /NCGR_PEP_ID=MMETSP0211-20121228/11427_1 /TAXON_ID=311385 /ORGANISM="Pseudokeronopsis sp., Strain OXSARD2" /LENGTH=97 /DNA_ID=CAMNT_0010862035 /DNA_START=100 /DNA_END=393 /DNA_ORIENTATION=+